MMHVLIKSIEAEYRRYKTIAEAALAQVREARLSEPGPAGGNSLAAICWHLSGNLESRFTVGQIVLLARSFCGERWRYLSIPPGGSAAYDANPAFEKPGDHESGLRHEPAD